jgi:hypothetical protein
MRNKFLAMVIAKGCFGLAAVDCAGWDARAGRLPMQPRGELNCNVKSIYGD